MPGVNFFSVKILASATLQTIDLGDNVRILSIINDGVGSAFYTFGQSPNTSSGGEIIASSSETWDLGTNGVDAPRLLNIITTGVTPTIRIKWWK